MLKYFLLLFVIPGFSAVYAQNANPNLNIIPAPVSVKTSPGVFTLSQETIIQADTPSNKAIGFFTAALLSSCNYRTQIAQTDTGSNTNVIRFCFAGGEL